MSKFKKIVFLITLIWLALLGAAQEKPKSLVIRDVRLFDGDSLVPKTSILVDAGEIAAIGDKIAIPAGAEVVDGRGMTLLPGLIDSHVHVFSEDALAQCLVFGVTTVVDMFTDVSFMKDIKAKQGAEKASGIAHLVSPGTLATAPGGHGTQYGLVIPTLTRPEEAPAWVDGRIAEGSDFIKIIVDNGGLYGRPIPTLDMPTVAALVTSAHQRSKMAVIHAATLKNCQDALQAGVDGLAHLYFDGNFDPQFGRQVAEKNAFVIPTLSVIEASGSRGDTDVGSDPRLVPYLLPNVMRALDFRFNLGLTPIPWELRQRVIRQLREANVAILAGTDAANPGTSYGISLHHELLLLVQAGLSPQEALRAATSIPADRFGIAGRGRIRPGGRADLLLVRGDPLADITATRDIVSVWHDGVRVEREKYREGVKREFEKIEQMKKSPPPPNSASGLVSDFEQSEVKAHFGSGWIVSTDSYRGGSSTADFERVKGGANGSSGALQIRGKISEQGIVSWAGAMWNPGASFWAPTNLSSWSGIRFWARGDERTFMVMVYSQSLGFMPAMKSFKTGPAWQEYVFSFKDFGIEGYDVMAVFFGASGGKGDFSLQIDDVRLK